MQPRVISESENYAALSSPTIADLNNFILSLHSVPHNTPNTPSLSFPHHCTIPLPLFPPFILQYFTYILNITYSPLHLLNLFN